MTGGMKRGFLMLSGGGAASKVLGAVREIALAQFFGTGAVADALRAALSLTLNPIHLFTRVIQAGFIPHYAQEKDGSAERAALYRAVSLLFLGISLLIAATLVLFAEPVVRLVLPGFSGERFTLTTRMLRVLAAGVPFYMYTTILGALGAAQSNYVIPAMRPAVQNVALIVFVVWAALSGRPIVAAWGFSGAYCALAIAATIYFRGRGLFPKAQARGADFKNPFWISVRPILLLSFVLQTNILAERAVTSLLGDGSMAGLDYARFLSETAHFLIAMPLGLMSLSLFARMDERTARDETDRLLALLLALFLALASLLFWRGDLIVRIIFFRGAFDATSLAVTTSALRGFAAGLTFFSASYLLQRILQARLAHGLVLRAEILGAAVNIAFNFLFYRSLGLMVIGLGAGAGALVSLAHYVPASRSHFRQTRRSLPIALALTAVYAFGVAWLLPRWGAPEWTGVALFVVVWGPYLLSALRSFQAK